MGTITMITRMLDPEQTCGINVEDTVSLRQRLTRASIRFGNTAGELFSLWNTTKMDYKLWSPYPGEAAEQPQSFVPFRDPPYIPDSPREKTQVSYDPEGHVLCDDHPPYQDAQDCPWCHYRKRSLIKAAKAMSPDFDYPDAFTTLVYEPRLGPRRHPYV